jgi:hypothetical protein
MLLYTTDSDALSSTLTQHVYTLCTEPTTRVESRCT